MNGTARGLASVALRWWWLILLSTAAAAALAYAASGRQSPDYEASTTLIVGRSLESSNLDPREIQSNEQLAQTYANLARRQPVLQGVVETLGLDTPWRALRKRIRVNPIQNTQLFEIVAKAHSRDQAEAIANETARQLIRLQTQSEQSREDEERQRFISGQLRDLSQKIDGAQRSVGVLRSRISTSPTQEEREQIRDQISSLERQIANWQGTYAKLLANAQPPSDSLTVVEPADATSRRVGPHSSLNTVVAGFLGALLGLAAASVWDRSGATFRSGREVSDELGLPFLGGVRREKGQHRATVTIGPDAAPPRAPDDYRIVRSNIEFLSFTKPVKSILVTTPTEGGATTTTALNLGVVMAQAGLRTILVDADMRRPALHDAFDFAQSPGLAEYLEPGGPGLDGALNATRVKGLRVLTTGVVTRSPAEFLDSPPMYRLFELLKPMADIIIIDSPPALDFPDAVFLSKHVDGVILVMTAGRTRRDAARSCMMLLERAGATLLGGVLYAAPTPLASAWDKVTRYAAPTPLASAWDKVARRIGHD